MFSIRKKPSLRSRFISRFLRYYSDKQRTEKKALTLAQIRETLAKQTCSYSPPKNVRVEQIRENGVNGEWQVPNDTPPETCIYYLHGGGYTIGSPVAHRPMTIAIAKAANTRVFSLDYRLAPEHPYPAALDDALQGYRWLLDQGFKPHQLVLAGDSAGGGLALALSLKLKSLSEALPTAMILISPWTDLTLSSDSIEENDKKCALLNTFILKDCTRAYTNNEDPKDPFISPLYGDLSGLPPLLMYVSSTEAIRDDSLRLTEKAKKSGVDVTLHLWPRQPHAWPIFYRFMPESKQCVKEMALFVKNHIYKTPSAS